LLARLQTLQRRHHPKTPPQRMHFGILNINLVQHQVSLGNNIIDLKPTEFELLVFLAKNADHIVNRENIMQALRGANYDGIDRSIDLRISYLRKKLHDDIQEPYRIKTVHGKGYIFISTAWDQ
jgi:DNA-binding response OmpR family regulator